MTTYIDPIKTMLEQNFPNANGLWNYSSDNQLATSWLHQTPTSVWSLPYTQFKQAVPGSGPLELATCTVPGSVNGTTELCQVMDASMTKPGQTAAKLLIGHSDALVDAVYDVMTSAQVLLDFTTLTPPTDRFLDMFKNALLYLSNKPDGQRPIVRILYSNPLPNLPALTAIPFIDDITSQLDPAKRMQIYVYVMSSSWSSWNHAKIVAADGMRAVVGGHNLWGPHYLGVNPVHDVSMRLTGSAARHAHDYANSMWAYGQWRQDHLLHWVTSNAAEVGLIAAYRPSSSSGPSTVQLDVLPDAGLYESLSHSFGPTGPGSIPVLAVGRAANTQANYLLPTLENWFFPFDEPGDQAIAKLVSLAQQTVRMSLQSFRLGPAGVIAGWNPALFQAMADAIYRGVNIYVVLSNPGAIAGGLTQASAPYDGDSPSTVNAKMAQTLAEQQGIPYATAERFVSQQFNLAQFRYSSDAAYPPKNVPIGNHAKTLIVDDTAFYIGSQNMYSSNLNEFGYIVEDAATAQSYLASYWTPLWNWSKSTASNAVDPDEQTSQQAEAMNFIGALDSDAMLHIKWAQLTDQRDAQPTAAGKLLVQHQMDELIASAGFDSTAATVFAGLAQPFFTEKPPSTEATPAATAFVANLMTDTTLMQSFSTVVYTPAGTIADYNAAINKWLTDHGYKCTALQVMAAFTGMCAVNLAYWSSTNTTWLTADGGVSYAITSNTSNAAQPHTLQARTSTATMPPAPGLGPTLVIGPDSVTYNNVAIKSYTYNNNVLSWQATNGNTTAASLRFGTVTRATMNDSFTGNEVFGTITYPAASGAIAAGTYSLYGRGGQSGGGGGGGGGGDNPWYTVGYVFAALAAMALLGALAYFTFKSVRSQQDWIRVAQEKRDSDEEDSFELEPVSSTNRSVEAAELQREIRLQQMDACETSLTVLAEFEPSMTTLQRTSLSKAAGDLRSARSTLEQSTAESLVGDVQRVNVQMDGIVASIKSLTTGVSKELSSGESRTLEENNALADTLTKASDDVTSQEEDDRPFEIED
ncbi:MAG TPA: phospholipase D-like domain-containing protein [Streptosporangiaceae bacterium]